MAPAALWTLGFRILTYARVFVLQNENGIAYKYSSAQGVTFGFVSPSGISKLMEKEIKGSKRPPETGGESFCGQGLLCT